MKIIVAITGASGAIYARRTLEHLLESEQVERIALILSDTAKQVIEHEGVILPASERIELYDNHEMFSSVASGSAAWAATFPSETQIPFPWHFLPFRSGDESLFPSQSTVRM